MGHVELGVSHSAPPAVHHRGNRSDVRNTSNVHIIPDHWNAHGDKKTARLIISTAARHEMKVWLNARWPIRRVNIRKTELEGRPCLLITEDNNRGPYQVSLNQGSVWAAEAIRGWYLNKEAYYRASALPKLCALVVWLDDCIVAL